MNNRETFFQFYYENLSDDTEVNPSKYPSIPRYKDRDDFGYDRSGLGGQVAMSYQINRQAKIEQLALDTIDFLAIGSADIDTIPVKRTCQQLGIETTREAIKQYLNHDD